MMRLGTKYFACTTILVGVALMIGGLSKGNARLNTRLPSKETASKESDAARFARYDESYDSTMFEGSSIFKEDSNLVAVNNMETQTKTMAKLTQTRNLKFNINSNGQQNGNENIKVNRQSANRQNGNKNRNGRNKLQDRIEGETIAETLSRIQIKLKPESTQMKKKQATHQLSDEDNSFPYRYPKIRYVVWDELTDDTKNIVQSSFGYTERLWNKMSNTIESNIFSRLTESQQKSALMLGIDENVWNCFINHYSSYSRKDLETASLYEYVTTLSGVQSKKWERLSESEIQAATKLCYSKETWNKKTLGTW